jgi:hypothetical protein
MGETFRQFANAASASAALKSSISPLFSTMITIAAVVCILVIVFGGYYYMTSVGNPEKLEHAKKTLRNAIIGFVVVLAAGSLVAVMQQAYSAKPIKPTEVAVQQPKADEPDSLNEVINNAIKGFVGAAVKSVGQSVVDLLKQFTTATPLLAQNGAVFNVWMIMVAIADVLLLLVIALIGFRIMGASVIGLGDVDIRSLVPQVVLAFIVANLSIFAIDAIISVSNAMIQALLIGMSNDIIWVTLGTLIATISQMNVGIMLLIAVAIILAIMLLVYYLQRMIVLYVGAVLSPLVVLLWLLPSFRDFAVTAVRMYLVTIFVLFVHVSILVLAVALFSSMIQGKENAFMSALLGIATLLVLLKTSKTVNQMAILGSSNHSMRRLGDTFVSGVSYMAGAMKQNPALATAGVGVSRSSTTTTAAMGGTRSVNPITSTPLATGETKQAPRRAAAEALTKKQDLPREVVVTKGTTKPNLTITERPTKKVTHISKVKGGKK